MFGGMLDGVIGAIFGVLLAWLFSRKDRKDTNQELKCDAHSDLLNELSRRVAVAESNIEVIKKDIGSFKELFDEIRGDIKLLLQRKNGN